MMYSVITSSAGWICKIFRTRQRKLLGFRAPPYVPACVAKQVLVCYAEARWQRNCPRENTLERCLEVILLCSQGSTVCDDSRCEDPRISIDQGICMHVQAAAVPLCRCRGRCRRSSDRVLTVVPITCKKQATLICQLCLTLSEGCLVGARAMLGRVYAIKPECDRPAWCENDPILTDCVGEQQHRTQ
jgi:hypothetical protein